MSKSEQETLLQYDPDLGQWTAWTNMPAVAAKWRRLGWKVSIFGRVKGEAHSWQASVPQRAVSYRRPAPSAARVAAGKARFGSKSGAVVEGIA